MQILTFLIVIIIPFFSPSTYYAPFDLSQDTSPFRTGSCSVQATLWVTEDFRGGANTFAYFDVEFWSGKRVTIPIAGRRESLPQSYGLTKSAIVPELKRSDVDPIRRVSVSYRTDEGDGVLLKPDSSRFESDFSIFCTGFQNSWDNGYKSLLSAQDYILVAILTGTGSKVIYEDNGFAPGTCRTDDDCSDRIVCNGVELCRPGKPGSNARGCRAGQALSCDVGKTCVEFRWISFRYSRRSETGCVKTDCVNGDKDGDGEATFECGGFDCNDRDPTMFPFNDFEQWDDMNKDEDCDPYTTGAQRHFQVPQLCDGEENVIVIPLFSGILHRERCPDSTVCVVQPFGGGFCMDKPLRYSAPPRFASPVLQTGYEPRLADRFRNVPIVPKITTGPVKVPIRP